MKLKRLKYSLNYMKVRLNYHQLDNNLLNALHLVDIKTVIMFIRQWNPLNRMIFLINKY